MSTHGGSSFQIHTFALVFFALAIILDCRAAELVSSLRQRRPGVTAVAARPTQPTSSPTATQVALVETPTETPTETLEPSPTELPTETPEPTDTATPRPTSTPAPPARKPTPTQTFTPAPPPSPTRCPDQYCAVYRGCQPDGGNTAIEGIVYANGAPENGRYVRVSLETGGYPRIDDFMSGTDPINPGKPDPAHPGRYYLQILAGGPQEGNWWVFMIDKPSRSGAQRISEAVFVHTNDGVASDSCQHAIVDFVRQ